MIQETELAEYVKDLLAGWGAVHAKRMFGGIGLFLDARMFGLIFDGQLYFRVDRATAAKSEHAFGYRRGNHWIRLPYVRVNAEALEEAARIQSLAEAAWLAAGRKQDTSTGAKA